MSQKTIQRPTQKQLIELGLSQSYASEILAGKKTPSLKLAKLIQDALGYPALEWMVGR